MGDQYNEEEIIDEDIYSLDIEELLEKYPDINICNPDISMLSEEDIKGLISEFYSYKTTSLWETLLWFYDIFFDFEFGFCNRDEYTREKLSRFTSGLKIDKESNEIIWADVLDDNMYSFLLKMLNTNLICSYDNSNIKKFDTFPEKYKIENIFKYNFF